MITDYNDFWKIHCFTVFPYKSIRDQIWRCREIFTVISLTVYLQCCIVITVAMCFTKEIIKSQSTTIWSPSSEFVSSSIPSWQILTAHAQPFRGARDLAFCLKVPLDSLLVWASSGGSGETARMRRLAWTFAARIGNKYQIRLTRSILSMQWKTLIRVVLKPDRLQIATWIALQIYQSNLNHHFFKCKLWTTLKNILKFIVKF